jgi:hypothetical protein
MMLTTKTDHFANLTKYEIDITIAFVIVKKHASNVQFKIQMRELCL